MSSNPTRVNYIDWRCFIGPIVPSSISTKVNIIFYCVQAIFCVIYVVIVYLLTSQPLEWFRFAMFLSSCLLIAFVAQSVGLVVGAAMNVQVTSSNTWYNFFFQWVVHMAEIFHCLSLLFPSRRCYSKDFFGIWTRNLLWTVLAVWAMRSLWWGNLCILYISYCVFSISIWRF